ncbi:MAG: hypothetical protein WCP85_01535 [Mariniphaga sp.]
MDYSAINIRHGENVKFLQISEEYRNDPVAIAECCAGSVTLEEYLKTLNKIGFTRIEIIAESKPCPKGKAE